MITETYREPDGFKGTPGKWGLDGFSYSIVTDSRIDPNHVAAHPQVNSGSFTTYWLSNRAILTQAKEMAKALQAYNKYFEQFSSLSAEENDLLNNAKAVLAAAIPKT